MTSSSRCLTPSTAAVVINIEAESGRDQEEGGGTELSQRVGQSFASVVPQHAFRTWSL